MKSEIYKLLFKIFLFLNENEILKTFKYKGKEIKLKQRSVSGY